MQYQGGKYRIAKKMLDAMHSDIMTATAYVEPFCGGLHVAERVPAIRPDIPLILSDGSAHIITLYRAWLDGWRPERITEEQWRIYRETKDPNDPMTAFAGHALSFGGRWFEGFARCSRGDDYHATGVRGLERKLMRLSDAQFSSGPYDAVAIPDGSVVYCDPPYVGTKPYKAVDGGVFDHDAFWAWARRISDRSQVYVSEYTAPDGWRRVWARDVHVSMCVSSNTKQATEALWCFGPQ